jgi:putative glutamine amidotransferase
MTLQALETASWHHQAIRQVAPVLRVVAHAPDGTIEAVESHDHSWLIAVQWHPELTAHRDPAQQRLFGVLVAAATARPQAQCLLHGASQRTVHSRE